MSLQGLLDDLFPYLIAVHINKEKDGLPEFDILFPENWIVKENENVHVHLHGKRDGKAFYRISSANPDEIWADDIINYIMFIIDRNKQIEIEKEKMERKLMNMQECVDFSFKKGKKGKEKKKNKDTEDTKIENYEPELTEQRERLEGIQSGFGIERDDE